VIFFDLTAALDENQLCRGRVDGRQSPQLVLDLLYHWEIGLIAALSLLPSEIRPSSRHNQPRTQLQIRAQLLQRWAGPTRAGGLATCPLCPPFPV
jgi:hypothetical protein